MEDGKEAARRLAASYADQGEPNGWFERFYVQAGGDIQKVYWADLEPNPRLISWLKQNPASGQPRATVIGCGLGDDAELLARHGYRVTAFDISDSAVSMCRRRYPGSAVDYRVADLLSPPPGWQRGFDLVFECNTIQILVGELRGQARDAIAELVAPGGVVLVSCRARKTGEKEDDFPVPILREEIDGFPRAGLSEEYFDAYDDDEYESVSRFFAVYRRAD